ncbi:unnamed protein product [Leptosia nina]|uniref:Uncharacterized protein n=1 Tax=Leptosia nina TaxID=320188 RepID=A0AAV1K440_9NEOP
MVTILSTILVIPTVFDQYEDAFLLQPSRGVKCAPQFESVNMTFCVYTTTNGSEVPCDTWRVNLMWIFWIERKWQIFCDQEMKLLSTTVICRLGLVFGCIFFGVLSDSFGRRLAIIINIVAEVILRIALAFCTTESWYRLLVFLKALFASSNHYLELILVCEIASNSWRTLLTSIVLLPQLLSKICAIPAANIALNQETYNFIAFLVGLIPLCLVRWIPESPQWLLYNRRIPLAEKNLVVAANKNDVKLCSDFKIRPVDHRVGMARVKFIFKCDNAYVSLDEEWTCLSILSTRNVRVIVSSTILIWTLFHFVWAPTYIDMYRQQNKFMLLQVLSMTVFMAVLNFGLAKKMKMRCLVILNVVVLGIASVFVIIAKRMCLNILLIEFTAALGVASGLVSYALLFNMTPRLLALIARATLVGCCYSAGEIGTITCYLLILYLQDLTVLILLVIAVLLVTTLCVVLPDVDARELPDTIRDMDYFSELSKPLRWATQKTNSPSYEEVEMRVHSFSSDANNSIIEHAPRPMGFFRLWYSLVKLFNR